MSSQIYLHKILHWIKGSGLSVLSLCYSVNKRVYSMCFKKSSSYFCFVDWVQVPCLKYIPPPKKRHVLFLYRISFINFQQHNETMKTHNKFNILEKMETEENLQPHKYKRPKFKHRSKHNTMELLQYQSKPWWFAFVTNRNKFGYNLPVRNISEKKKRQYQNLWKLQLYT